MENFGVKSQQANNSSGYAFFKSESHNGFFQLGERCKEDLSFVVDQAGIVYMSDPDLDIDRKKRFQDYFSGDVRIRIKECFMRALDTQKKQSVDYIDDDEAPKRIDIKPLESIFQEKRLLIRIYQPKENAKTRTAVINTGASFRILANNANDGMMIAHEDGYYVYANKKALEITKYTYKEFLELTIFDLAHPEEREIMRNRLKKRMAGNKVETNYESRIIRKDGKIVPVAITVSKTIWKNKPALFAIMRDISKNKDTMSAIKASESRYKSFICDFKGIVYESDLNKNFLFIQGAVQNVTGYTEADFMNDAVSFNQLVLPSYIDVVKKHTKDVVEKRLTSHSAEYRIRKKNGDILWVKERATIVLDESGMPVMIRGTVTDIQKYKQKEQIIRDEEKALRETLLSYRENKTAFETDMDLLPSGAGTHEKNARSSHDIKAIIDAAIPIIEKLKQTTLSHEQEYLLCSLEEKVLISAPKPRNIPAVFRHFTPAEIEITNLIKEGKTTKEIAELLNKSSKTIESHRKSIRKKIGIQNRKNNLRTMLLTI